MTKPFDFELPDEIQFVLQTLNLNNHRAYVVGGSVRDAILGNTAKDWDITTSALPNEVERLFDKTIDTGLKHGTVTVVINNQNIEVTTFRTDGNYLDNRRPESVNFIASLEEDLSRRDFTINSIAYHPDIGYIDPFDGISDINNKIIRTVGDPNQRFSEDALRMLRAVRFSSQLDFGIDKTTQNSIYENGYLLRKISQERIRDELTKLIVSNNPLKFSLLEELDILNYLIPEFEICFKTTQNNPHHVHDIALHSLYAMSYIENSSILRWTMLLHDVGKAYVKSTDDKGIDHFFGHEIKSKELAETILKRLKFDNKSIDLILRLIEYHDFSIAPDGKSIRKALQKIGEDVFLDLLKVKESDRRAQSSKFLEEELNKLSVIKDGYEKIKGNNQCVSLKNLKINGFDLLSLGIKQGEKVGMLLNTLLDKVIETPELNDKEKLIQIVKDQQR